MTITRPAPKSQAHLAAMMPTGPAPKTTTVSPGWIPPHLGCLKSCWHHVGEEYRVVRVHAFRNERGTHVGVRDADVLCLPTVVAACGVRIAEDATHRGGLGVGLVAIAVQTLPTEDARPAGDVERHQNVVAHLQLPYALPELLHHAGELVAERHPHPCIRDGSIV